MSKKLNTYTEQPAAENPPGYNESPTVFLGIGVVINVVMITAYFIWAYKQWKKANRRDEGNTG